MGSAALERWNGERHSRLKQLRAAHQQVSTGQRGRQWATEQIVWAMVVRLCGEFQAYVAELIGLYVGSVAASAPAHVQSTIAAGMQSEMRMSAGNPTSENVKRDFRRLGLDIWGDLAARTGGNALSKAEQARWSSSGRAGTPSTSSDFWKLELDQLCVARNGIAHADDQKLRHIRAAGYPLRMTTINGWKRSLDGLVREMDDLASDRLASLLSTPKPW